MDSLLRTSSCFFKLYLLDDCLIHFLERCRWLRKFPHHHLLHLAYQGCWNVLSPCQFLSNGCRIMFLQENRYLHRILLRKQHDGTDHHASRSRRFASQSESQLRIPSRLRLHLSLLLDPYLCLCQECQNGKSENRQRLGSL